MNKSELLNLLKNGKILEAATRCRKEVMDLVPGYVPEGPHLAGSARKDASKFEASSWAELVDLMTDQDGNIPVVKDNGVAICASVSCADISGARVLVGTTRESTPVSSGPWIVVKQDHGLMAKGPAEKRECKTEILTLVFTDEGAPGFVLATMHPGPPEEPGNYEGLEEGALLSMGDLKERNITRVIPE